MTVLVIDGAEIDAGHPSPIRPSRTSGIPFHRPGRRRSWPWSKEMGKRAVSTANGPRRLFGACSQAFPVSKLVEAASEFRSSWLHPSEVRSACHATS